MRCIGQTIDSLVRNVLSPVQNTGTYITSAVICPRREVAGVVVHSFSSSGTPVPARVEHIIASLPRPVEGSPRLVSQTRQHVTDSRRHAHHSLSDCLRSFHDALADSSRLSVDLG